MAKRSNPVGRYSSRNMQFDKLLVLLSLLDTQHTSGKSPA